MKIAIIEDKKFDRDHLSTLLRRYFHLNYDCAEISAYIDYDAFKRVFERDAFFFIFIDEEVYKTMPEDAIDALSQIDTDVLFVIVHSGMSEKTTNPQVRFLQKPYSAVELGALLDEELRDYFKYTRAIQVKAGKQTIDLLMTDITYANIEGHNTVIHLESGKKIPVRMTFGRFLDLIYYDTRFLICNRSLAVNMDKIVLLDENTIVLQDGTTIDLKRPLQKKPLNQYREYKNL